jgi:hypothetical protein
MLEITAKDLFPKNKLEEKILKFLVWKISVKSYSHSRVGQMHSARLEHRKVRMIEKR